MMRLKTESSYDCTVIRIVDSLTEREKKKGESPTATVEIRNMKSYLPTLLEHERHMELT
jgi:hypothetical protein